ncbi:MAG: nucleotide exchange factor GrpE [bacterium]|nr:nucleotide exchange factor GrpE [bacterium]
MAKEDKKTKEQKEQVEGLINQLRRVMADYQNLEKRIGTEKEEFAKFANAGLVSKILPALDSLEKAKEHIKDEGLSLATKQLMDGLAQEGLERIEAEKGEDFDPNLMECVEVGKGTDNKVLDVLREGYKLNGRILRVAQVKVGKEEINKKATEEAEEEHERGDYV